MPDKTKKTRRVHTSAAVVPVTLSAVEQAAETFVQAVVNAHAGVVAAVRDMYAAVVNAILGKPWVEAGDADVLSARRLAKSEILKRFAHLVKTGQADISEESLKVYCSTVARSLGMPQEQNKRTAGRKSAAARKRAAAAAAAKRAAAKAGTVAYNLPAGVLAIDTREAGWIETLEDFMKSLVSHVEPQDVPAFVESVNKGLSRTKAGKLEIVAA